MDSRCGELGYVATEFHPGTDTSEFESFYNFSNTDGKKLAQLTSQSRFPGDFFSSTGGGRVIEHAMDMRTSPQLTTSVSVEESDFLEEFMACDFPEAGGRDRSVASSLGSMTDLSLAELDNLPRHSVGAAGSGHKFSSYDQEQENRFPGTHHRRNTTLAYGKLIFWITESILCMYLLPSHDLLRLSETWRTGLLVK